MKSAKPMQGGGSTKKLAPKPGGKAKQSKMPMKPSQGSKCQGY